MAKIIADISGNHGGSLEKAMDLIRAAADCGCDYAKFQYYDPKLMPDYCGNEAIYDRLHVPMGWLILLFNTAERADIPLFASVFDVGGVDDLYEYNPPFFKIASPESTRLNNYEEIVGQIRRGTPIIFSTGNRDWDLMAGLARGDDDVLLYCPSGHPTPPLTEWDNEWHDGLSDHCATLDNAIYAIRRGAEWVERHLKLDDDCIDSEFSSNPQEMAALCKRAHR